VTGQPIAISDDAMAELMDRTKFIEAVVAELDGHAEVDSGLVHRVGAQLQCGYLGFARGTGKGRYR
jgi:hypothetical protein